MSTSIVKDQWISFISPYELINIKIIEYAINTLVITNNQRGNDIHSNMDEVGIFLY